MYTHGYLPRGYPWIPLAEDRHIGIIERDVPASPAKALPTITFRQQITFHLNDEEVTVLHLANAHTEGDAAVLFKKANVIHAGDILFIHGYPFIDRAGMESYLAMLHSFRDIISREIADGKDLESILADRPTAGLDEVWGRHAFSPAQFTEIVFRSLRKE
ncbi:MAG: hypothetical protein V2A76_04580 [Planctomycetota bacterium]